MERTRESEKSPDNLKKEDDTRAFNKVDFNNFSLNHVMAHQNTMLMNHSLFSSIPIPPGLSIPSPSSTQISTSSMVASNAQLPKSIGRPTNTAGVSRSEFLTSTNGKASAAVCRSTSRTSDSQLPVSSNRLSSLVVPKGNTMLTSSLPPVPIPSSLDLSSANTRNAMAGGINFSGQDELLRSLDHTQPLDMNLLGSGDVEGFPNPDLSKCLPMHIFGRGSSLRRTSSFPDDMNFIPHFLADDGDNKERLHQLIKQNDQQKLMEANDRKTAETLKHRMSKPLPSATVTRQNSSGANLERQHSSEIDTSSATTTPSATAATESRKERGTPPDQAGSTSSISPVSSTEEAHSSGVSSTNGAKKGRIVPDEQKDDAYWEKRRKNNESAKRSREARRAKEAQISYTVICLEQSNIALQTQIDMITRENELMRSELERRRLTREARARQEQGGNGQEYDYSQQQLPHQKPPPPPPPGASGGMHM